jgi:hypothetical protein
MEMEDWDICTDDAVQVSENQNPTENDLTSQLAFIDEQIQVSQSELNSASFYLKRDLSKHLKELVSYKNEVEQELQDLQSKRHLLENSPKDPEKEAEHYKSKADIKRHAKQHINKKFIVGNKYVLKFKNKGVRTITCVFECKQYVYTMDLAELNMVIMKRIGGTYTGKVYTLSQTDCKRLHVKYEPGLECFPMDMNWLPYNEKK